MFRNGLRGSMEDVSFLYHSLGSLELAASRFDEAKAAFLEGLARQVRSLAFAFGTGYAASRAISKPMYYALSAEDWPATFCR